MSKITIPRDDDEAREVASVATMSEWALAGYVASQVQLDNQPGPRSVTSDRSLTPAEFAAKGIRGLRSKNTVQLYAERWQETGLPIPEPGEIVDIGDRDWPPTSTTTGGRNVKDPGRRGALSQRAKADGVGGRATRGVACPHLYAVDYCVQ